MNCGGKKRKKEKDDNQQEKIQSSKLHVFFT